MNNGQPDNPIIVQTSRGPSMNGARLTVYHIMDMLKYGRSPDFVQGWYHLTDEEMAAVMQYLKQNEEELEFGIGVCRHPAPRGTGSPLLGSAKQGPRQCPGGASGE
jgi:uncharacterized protein (DUF433 family)